MLTSKISSQPSDEELIFSLQKGLDNALTKLMERYKKPLFYFITRYIKDEDISYDILQETFIKVYNRAETFNVQYKFKTWLYQIAFNLCRDYARKQKLHSFLSLDAWIGNENKNSLHDVLMSDENIENLVEQRQTLQLVEEQIAKLPHKLKTALILFSIENHSQKECAKILSVTPKIIETRVYRARKILLQQLSKNL